VKVTVLVRKKSRNVEAVNQAVTIANRIQPEFEFDVEQVKWLPKGDIEVKPGQVLSTIKENHAGRPIIAVISPPLKGNYFECAGRRRNVVSTADWENRYAPPRYRFTFSFSSRMQALRSRRTCHLVRLTGGWSTIGFEDAYSIPLPVGANSYPF
jgi:hypothetical protein